MMANVRAERLLKIPAEPSPELRIPNAAAQTRMVSVAKIRLDSRKSVQSFKGIICAPTFSGLYQSGATSSGALDRGDRRSKRDRGSR
jgi:hypothetical protein